MDEVSKVDIIYRQEIFARCIQTFFSPLAVILPIPLPKMRSFMKQLLTKLSVEKSLDSQGRVDCIHRVTFSYDRNF